MFKAYKYRIYPTKAQQVLMEKHFGCARFVYNWGLATQQAHYKAHGKSLSKRKLQDQLVQMKQTEQYAWLKEVNSQTLLAALFHLHDAFQHFFKGKGAYPNFKKKYRSRTSFQCPQHSTVDFVKQRIHLTKLPNIKAKISRPFTGEIKTVTVSKDPSGKYYASVLVDDGKTEPIPTTIQADLTLGIDLGITHLLTLSDGTVEDNPKHLNKAKERLAITQKIFARKKQGSSNRERQRKQVASAYEKVRHQRLNTLHHITHRLVRKNHATSFAIEDLGIKNMVKNRKLAKAIHDAGWGTLINLLRYKANWYGKNVLVVDRFFASSKLCSHCGHKMAVLPLSVRQWTCPACHADHNRDHNASCNIRRQALAEVVGLTTV